MPGAQALAGRYVVGELLGSGGVAHVHRARDTLLERDVAVKLFGPGIDLSGPQRERTEMRLLANLTHPHLVTVYDAGTDLEHTPPRAYLVMALIDGPSLGQRLGAGPLEPRAVRRIGRQVAEALAHVHSRDVVHRDVKPANILLDAAGGAYLADFGVAQSIGATALTATGMTVGTAAFLSPEQVRGELVGPASDVYALGLVLLEALTGEREYTGTSAEAAVARLARPPRIAGRVPAPWEALLTAMAQPEAAARPTAAEVATALRAGGPVGAERTQVFPGDAGRTEVLARPGGADRTRVLTAPPSAAARRPPAARARAGRPAAWHARPVTRVALGVGAALLVALVAVGVASSSDGPGPTGIPDPPAGAPGPARLTADLTRLQELVRP